MRRSANAQTLRRMNILAGSLFLLGVAIGIAAEIVNA
jgi:hypothetical protein